MKLMLTAFLFFSSLLVAETRLAILGSGTPNPDPERMGSAYAVIVNENAYLVDFGPGVIRRAAELSSNWGGEIDALVPANLKYAFFVLKSFIIFLANCLFFLYLLFNLINANTSSS